MSIKRIPTLLALLFLVLLVGVTAVATQQYQSLTGRASVGTGPKNIRVTNISDSSFSVSYLTDGETKGSAGIVGEVFFPDDRDSGLDQSKSYNTHHITIKNLSPGTKYKYQVENGTTTYEITTAPRVTVSATAAEPIYGTVSKTDGSPAYGGIVYLSPFGGSPISTIVKTNGNFLLPVNNIRTADLKNYLSLKVNDPETIFIEGGKDGVSTVLCVVGKDKPVPNIVLGKDTSCTVVEGVRPVTKAAVPVPVAEDVSVITPYEGEKILIGQPTFKGTAPVGKIIQIEVKPDLVTGIIRADAAGKWLWTPAEDLSLGSHVLTISYLDSGGTTKKIIRNFSIKAAGGDSIMPLTVGTPSAVIKPKPQATPPVSGRTEEMFILLTAGSLLVTLGMSTIYKALWIR